MTPEYSQMIESLASIGSELFRFQRVYEKAIQKLEIEEQNKYMSQFAWFSKKVSKSLSGANLKILNLEGQEYDPGMAVTPLNIEDFDIDDRLYIFQMIEPIIMRDDAIYKTGTAILGRVVE